METTIIPSEKIPAKNKKQDDKLPPYLPPARGLTILQGSAGSGKSSLLYSMIREYQKTNYFDIIIVYNRCSDSDFVWRGFQTKKTDVKIFNSYNNEELLDIIMNLDEEQQDRRRAKPEKRRLLNVLFVFDDMVYSGICSSYKQSALDELVINRRHMNASIMITSQSYKALNQNIRTNNVSQMIVLRANARDLINIGEEHNAGVCNVEDFIGMYNFCKGFGNYEYLVVDYRKPQDKMFSRGFKTTLKPTTGRKASRLPVEEAE
jgi:hypothetical protein